MRGFFERICRRTTQIDLHILIERFFFFVIGINKNKFGMPFLCPITELLEGATTCLIFDREHQGDLKISRESAVSQCVEALLHVDQHICLVASNKLPPLWQTARI